LPLLQPEEGINAAAVELSDNNGTFVLPSLADLEQAQLAQLSSQLKEIRIRYERLKRLYLAKMRWLNEQRLLGTTKTAGTKRLNKFKVNLRQIFPFFIKNTIIKYNIKK
jgi:hypothetical protein